MKLGISSTFEFQDLEENSHVMAFHITALPYGICINCIKGTHNRALCTLVILPVSTLHLQTPERNSTG
jgi:hypothetical protein